jgi:3-oxoacyl-[acyl-carrier protein] reductase
MAALAEQVALVTGAGSGIGLAITRRLAREGATVVLSARSADKLRAAATDLAATVPGAMTLIHPADVRCPADNEAMVQAAHDRFGRLDLFIAAAGTIGTVSHDKKLPPALSHLPEDEWDLILDTNLKGLVYGTRAALRAMMPRGQGEVVLIGSYPASLRGSPHAAAYTASKHAVRGLAQSLAEEVRPFGIRVQALFPGPTDTPMLYGSNAISRHGVLTPDQVAARLFHLVTLPRDTQLGESTLYAITPPTGGDDRAG